MTNQFGEEQQADALTKALGVMALLEMISNINQVVGGFEIASVFTPEGTTALNGITIAYFKALNELISAEREIFQIQNAQRDI